MQCVVDLPVNQELLKPAARWLIYKTMFANYLPLCARDKKFIRGLCSRRVYPAPKGGTRGGECNDVADNAKPGKGRKRAEIQSDIPLIL